MFAFTALDVDSGAAASPASESMDFALFRPHLFFYRPWEGRGETFTPDGKRLVGFTVRGEGRSSSQLGRIVQDWHFDNGLRHTAEWKVLSTSGADYRAVDANTGVEARGRQAGDAFMWVMKVKGPTPFGVRTVRTVTVYRMKAPGVAEAHSTSTIFGFLPINRSVATYRRIEA